MWRSWTTYMRGQGTTGGEIQKGPLQKDSVFVFVRVRA